MKSLCLAFIVLGSIATLFSVADAHRFEVGGNGDWVVNPHWSYNAWAERNRFQVNDTLYFKYAKGSDSVQEVAKADYEGCNVKNPIKKFDNGETEVALKRSGPFYFISGNQEHCTKGQKLIVFVLGIRTQPKVPISPAKAPSTAQPPKSHSPVAPAKAPSTAQPPKPHSPVSPVAPAKSPKAHSPVSPAKPPSMTQPPKAHSPVSPAKPPSMTQPPKAHWPVSPSKAPTTSPATHSPPSKSPSPSTSSPPSPKSPSPAAPPKPSASSPPKSSPATPAASSPTPSESTPTADNNTAPAPSPKSAATVVTVTSVMSTLFGVAFTVFMFA
ncbi:hypothetical protein N665_1923s0002 [Sinapis alba]|nr:hypothetical protein N665_1923s0002 [Sinapis alba]